MPIIILAYKNTNHTKNKNHTPYIIWRLCRHSSSTMFAKSSDRLKMKNYWTIYLLVQKIKHNVKLLVLIFSLFFMCMCGSLYGAHPSPYFGATNRIIDFSIPTWKSGKPVYIIFRWDAFCISIGEKKSTWIYLLT